VEEIMAGLGGDDDEGSGGGMVGTTLGRLAALAPLLHQLERVSRVVDETEGTRATMPPVELRR